MADNSSNNVTLSGDLLNVTTDTYNYVNNMLVNPIVLIIIIVIFVIYIIFFMNLGNSSTNTNAYNEGNTAGEFNFIGILLIGVFLALLLINGFQYFFGTDIVATIKNVFTNEPEVDITVNLPTTQDDTTVPEIQIQKQVFNIPGNNYNYENAKALCKAYDARLATYKEVENSYNDGGEWCSYGWTDGQMALFPTQPSTFDQLQTIEGHQNDCGRPGVNGGYMANPELKFGVNCYGYKPKMTPEEEELMATQPKYPVTKKDIEMELRVDYWKRRLSEILVAPFNNSTWSKL
jgi:heme/copper-type cytochrome/quinol oxidase subunit 2